MKGEGKTFAELMELTRHGEYAKHPRSVAMQMLYCDLHYKPVFIPLDGYCPSCNRNIFDIGGYSVDDAGERLLTCCPYCHKSFCD